MHFPVTFTRVVAAGTTWAQDVLPQDAAGNFLQPGIGTAATANGALNDDVLQVAPGDGTGNPVHRVAVGYYGPALAPYFGANLYAWDAATRQYFKCTQGQKTLRPGSVTYFDLITLASAPVRAGNLDQALNMGTALVLIVTPPPSGMANGTYAFAMGASITSLGVDQPAADDEANGLVTVVPSDSANLPNGAARFLYVAAAGAVKFAAVDDTDANAITLAAVPAFTKIPVKARKVFATGTTATVLAAY